MRLESNFLFEGNETGPGHACCKARRWRGLHRSNGYWARERVRLSHWMENQTTPPVCLLQISYCSFLSVDITAFQSPPWTFPLCIRPSWWPTICATPLCCRKALRRNWGKHKLQLTHMIHNLPFCSLFSFLNIVRQRKRFSLFQACIWFPLAVVSLILSVVCNRAPVDCHRMISSRLPPRISL